VVLAFHGGFGTGGDMARRVGLNAVAGRQGFLAIYPDAIDKHWSDGRSTTEGIDDVGFVRAIISYLSERMPIDRERIYATGLSNGGYFTQRLACEAADLLAAAAPVISSMPVPLYRSCRPGRPVPMFMISGKDDPLVPWGGGALTRGERLGGRGGEIVAVADAAAFWAKNNGCSGAETHLLPDTDPRDGTRVEETRFDHCSKNAAVVLWGIQGGGHAWPGAKERTKVKRIVGQTSRDVSGAEAIWQFFSRHER
jgi:polyhydroxybutyrate depolymerase